MYKVNGTTITMTRGDTVIIQIDLKRGTETYVPQEGDVIRFAVKRSNMNSTKTAFVDTTPVISKIIPHELILTLEPNETKDLPFRDYVYDIEMTYANGDVDTFIAEARLIIAPEVE